MRNYTGRQEPLPTYPASNCFILRNVGVWLRHHAQAKLYVAGTMHLPCALKVYFRTGFQSEKVCNLDLSLPSHLTLPLQVDISQVVIKHMQEQHRSLPNLEYVCTDCRRMPCFRDCSFASAIDKGNSLEASILEARVCCK